MAKNLELKAYAYDFNAQIKAVEHLTSAAKETLFQEDVFFRAAQARLKLRKFADGSAELIAYSRPDYPDGRFSEYERTPITHSMTLEKVLQRACGVIGVVRKSRIVYIHHGTRIHFDRVEGLGDFVEIEVVMPQSMTESEAKHILESWKDILHIHPSQVLAKAYIDLLLELGKIPGPDSIPQVAQHP